MPAIYQAICNSCLYESHRIHTQSMAIRLDSGEVVKLGHPGESYYLEELGYSWKQANREKRLVDVVYLICCNCGENLEKYTVDSAKGCLLPFISLLIIGLLGYFLLPFSIYINLVIVLLFFLIFNFIFNRNEDIKNRAAQKLLPTLSTCPNCHQRQFEELKSLSGKNLVCPKCKEKQFTYKYVART